MKIKYLVAITLLCIVFSCSKDNNGQLTLKVKSVSSDIVGPGQDLQVDFSFTEKGHVIDSITMIKVRINQDQLETIRDTLSYGVPAYPKSSKGELQLLLDYDFDLTSAVNPPPIDTVHFESDTLILKFVAHDVANNHSDTPIAGPIVILR